MSKKKLLEDMKQNPRRFYRAPADVVRDRRFTDDERQEILAAWENLGSPKTAELQLVLDALKEVEQKLADIDAPLESKE